MARLVEKNNVLKIKILQKIFFYMLFESKKLYFCSLKTETVL